MSKKILVNNSEPTQLTFSAGPTDLIRLNPGVNEVDGGVFDRVIEAAEKEKKASGKAGGILIFMEDEKVYVVSGKEDGDDSGSTTGKVKLDALTVPQAQDVISAEGDLEVLANLLEDEQTGKDRTGVVKAIEEQIALISKAEDDED